MVIGVKFTYMYALLLIILSWRYWPPVMRWVGDDTGARGFDEGSRRNPKSLVCWPVLSDWPDGDGILGWVG
jgi:hypothetical protein